MLTRLTEFLDKNDIIYKHRFEFKKKKKNQPHRQSLIYMQYLQIHLIKNAMLAAWFGVLKKYLILSTSKYPSKTVTLWYLRNCQEQASVVFYKQEASC